MLTWTARGALNVTNSATGQENALPPGIAHEVLIAEPHSPQDTHTAPTDPVTEPTLNPVQSSNVFDEAVADIAQVHCDSSSRLGSKISLVGAFPCLPYAFPLLICIWSSQ